MGFFVESDAFVNSIPTPINLFRNGFHRSFIVYIDAAQHLIFKIPQSANDAYGFVIVEQFGVTEYIHRAIVIFPVKIIKVLIVGSAGQL